MRMVKPYRVVVTLYPLACAMLASGCTAESSSPKDDGTDSDRESETVSDTAMGDIDVSSTETERPRSSDSATDNVMNTDDTGDTGGSAVTDAGIVPTAPCADYEDGVVVGTLFAAIEEASGMVSSRRQQDVLWLHEDANNTPSLFAIRPDGSLLGEWLIDVEQRIEDWEDIAIQPVANGPDVIWVGDIGDNEAREQDPAKPPRSFIQVMGIGEPTVDMNDIPNAKRIDTAEVFTLTYPDRPHDAEAMSIDPTTGDLYIFTKEQTAPATIFRAKSPIQSGELEAVAAIDMTWIDGADFAMGGKELIIRNYFFANYWERPGETAWIDVLQNAATRVSLEREPMGESIAFTADASGFYTVSEGEAPPIYFYEKGCL